MNPYVELGISQKATLEELKYAYRKAVLRYHPDTAQGKGDPEKFNAIVQAYRLLKSRYEKTMTENPGLNHCKPKYTRKKEPSVKIIDQKTIRMPLYELAFCLENSDNPYVRLIAIEAIALKRHPTAIHYLKHLAEQEDETTQYHIVRALGQADLHQASTVLFPFLFARDPQLAIEAIKSLERINSSNRKMILRKLRQKHVSIWKPFVSSIAEQFQRLTLGQQGEKLGEILYQNNKLSQDQLELSLLLQKHYHLLLGEILCKLEYVSSLDIQRALVHQHHK